MLFDTIALTLFALIAIPVALGISVKAPQVVALSLIGVLFMFSSSSWGQLQVENTIYSRGVGVLSFSLLNVLLFIAGAAVLIRKLADPIYPRLAPPLSAYFWGFSFLLLAHVLVGVISGVDVLVALSYTGIINVLNMMIFMYLAIMAFRDEKNRRALIAVIIVLAAIRAVFGIVRYVWFDGDSANPYRNFEGLDIKILFFDIADNFVASLAAFLAAWLLTSPMIRLSALKRIALYLFLALEVAAVALSFRRASLIGMALMFAFLVYRLPRRRRLQFMLLGAAMLFVAATVFFQQRLQYNTSGNFFSGLIYDISSEKKPLLEGRFYELWAAAQSIGSDWLFGLGTWGTFRGDQQLLDYHLGRFNFVHSGFGHIVLKTGLVGLALFCGLLFKFARYYFRHCNFLSGHARLLADAGFAGLLFWLPTLLIGTPIIEFRTMLLIGLTMALPFIAVGMQTYRPANHVVA
ncbi:MAG TPA: O-antigen ligase family protein [Burkholderiaceae bacterium]|jgi:hypothetical protein|nr:O-antigen ligase family protein [Burkholderiaceae bacterium]